MPTLDQRLLDPTPEEVARTLLRAMRAANRGLTQRRVERGLAFWGDVVRRAAAQPEGVRFWQGGRANLPAAYLGLAWWTDRAGRRHYRVVGRRLRGTDFQGARSPLAAWPLWQVYPDRVVLRRRDGRDALLVACSCGECGAPSALGWDGWECGPCHDRREELGQSAPPRPLRWQAHSRAVYRLAFTSTGSLFSAGDDHKFLFWDLATGQRHALPVSPRGSYSALAVAPDGTVAVCGRRVACVWLLGRDGEEMRSVHAPVGRVAGLAFAPAGRVLVWGTQGTFLADPANPLFSRRCLPGYVIDRAALAPDGRTVFAVGGFGLLLRGDLDGAAVPFGPEPPEPAVLQYDFYEDIQYGLFLDSSPDGRWLAFGASYLQEGHHHVLHVPSGDWWELPGPVYQPHLAAPAFAPDGTLAVASGDGTVRFWDPAARRERGSLLVERYRPTALAFAPDGEALALGSEDGALTLLPWKRLLAAP